MAPPSLLSTGRTYSRKCPTSVPIVVPSSRSRAASHTAGCHGTVQQGAASHVRAGRRRASAGAQARARGVPRKGIASHDTFACKEPTRERPGEWPCLGDWTIAVAHKLDNLMFVTLGEARELVVAGVGGGLEVYQYRVVVRHPARTRGSAAPRERARGEHLLHPRCEVARPPGHDRASRACLQCSRMFLDGGGRYLSLIHI